MTPQVVKSYAELLQVLRDRREEIDLSLETLDDLAGLSSRYAAKLFCDPPMRGLGQMSFGAVLGALGLKLLVVEDREQTDRMRPRWKPRERRRAPPCRCVVAECIRRQCVRYVSRRSC